MYILKDGKLYIQNGENTMVGVEIYSDHVIQVKESMTDITLDCVYLTHFEVFTKFQITPNHPYIFPFIKPIKNVKLKGVIKNDTTGETKKPVRKSRSK